jgi:hypothetical protein
VVDRPSTRRSKIAALVVTAGVSFACPGCIDRTDDSSSTLASSVHPASSGAGSSGTTDPSSSASGIESVGPSSPVGDDAAAGDPGQAWANDARAGDAAEASTACVKGLVTPNEVVLLGDSYLDPAFSAVATDLYSTAQTAGLLPASTTYRHYYQGGASMNNGSLQFNIPFQYETEALGDAFASNPRDIRVVIMDGGGNDVLINDRSCLTSAPPGNSGCVNTIQGVFTRTTSLFREMAANGTKNIVYFFYPHVDPNGGGVLPQANTADQTLDYAYPLAEQVCCGTSFTSSATNYTCTGTIGDATCTFIDTRPAFGESWGTLINQADYVHPTAQGAQIIANLIWKAMQDQCIAQ